VVGQVALAFVLAIAAGLLAERFMVCSAPTALQGGASAHLRDLPASREVSRPDHMAQLYSRALHTLQCCRGSNRWVWFTRCQWRRAGCNGDPHSWTRSRTSKQPYVDYMFASPAYFATVHTLCFADAISGLRHPRFRAGHHGESCDGGRALAGRRRCRKAGRVATTKYPVRTIIGIVANVKQSSLRNEPRPDVCSL